MGLLDGKTALVFGLANERSIAWGISKAFDEQGACLGFSYAPVVEKYALPLATRLGSKFIEPCDVTSDEQIARVARKARKYFKHVDILVHSVAFAGRDELSKHYYHTSREGFRNTLDISVFSLVALTKAFLPFLNPAASILTLTYGSGSAKVAPHYNVMGVAKAALESSVRYLAYDLGPRGIRVNAISAGAIRTLSAAGVSGFRDMYKHFADISPMLYVDSGFNIMGVQLGPKEEKSEGQ
jgi:enoyl-[acyl-carrier protein] reductase I